MFGVACGTAPPPAEPPANGFAFGVFGDGPYTWREGGRFHRLLADVRTSPASFFIHVGDILWYPCSDSAFAARRDDLTTIGIPVIYTPGDNEWADCHEAIAGRYVPSERLETIRKMFFSEDWSGASVLGLETQADDKAHTEFVENVRFEYLGVVFATLHMVGSRNGLRDFPGRSRADDAEVERRTTAALSWMVGTFEVAARHDARAVVLMLHGDPFEISSGSKGYEQFVPALARAAAAWNRPILLVHGDNHELRIDRPLVDPVTEDSVRNLTRLETFGSPDIGWIYVTVDTLASDLFAFEPRLMPGRFPR